MTETDDTTVWDLAREDIVDVPVWERLSSVLVNGGVLMFGVGLGVKWGATKSLTHIGNTQGWQSDLLPALAEMHNAQMKLAIGCAAALLIAGILIESRRSTDE